MTRPSRSVPPVWLAAAVGAVLVGLVSGAAYLTWLPVVLAGSLLLTFVIQLGLRRKEGLVTRMIVSVAGALAVLVIATAVLAVLRPAGLGLAG